ncbi:hypothetical protein SteCoe_23057 [Stentor coeruleus]|uniref:Uncharacterized protein n=1 Tax=Stentor coeruleus TaxID=5963 RepID=A0A1R2BKR3_9CILI|nr:hypothetical protein SteCoe_23057 [Stentor coeruleus]
MEEKPQFYIGISPGTEEDEKNQENQEDQEDQIVRTESNMSCLELKVTLGIPLLYSELSPLPQLEPCSSLPMDVKYLIEERINSKVNQKFFYLLILSINFISILSSFAYVSGLDSLLPDDDAFYNILGSITYFLLVISLLASMIMRKMILRHVCIYIYTYEGLALSLLVVFVLFSSISAARMLKSHYDVFMIYISRIIVLFLIMAFTKCYKLTHYFEIFIIIGLLGGMLESWLQFSYQFTVDSFMFSGLLVLANMVLFRLIDKHKIFKKTMLRRRNLSFFTILFCLVTNGAVIRCLTDISLYLNKG